MDAAETAKLAIQAALDRNWKTAIELNLKLFKDSPKDIDTLNRLGRAYLETGQKTKAEEIYKKVLRQDKFNSIAIKSLGLLHTSRVARGNSIGSSTPPPIFLEEPGITKTVSLTRLGDPKVISRLHPGDPVIIVAREHSVCVTTNAGENLGRLPDDLALRVGSFLKAGNKYHAWIRTIEPATQSALQSLKIFIKEVFRASKFRSTPSFPITEKLTYAAFTPPELVHDEKPKVPGSDDSEEYVDPDAEVENQETELRPASRDDD